MPKTDKDLNMGNLNEKQTDFSRNPSRTGTGTTGTGTTGTKHEPDTYRRPTEDYKGSSGSGNITEEDKRSLSSDVEHEGMSGSETEQ